MIDYRKHISKFLKGHGLDIGPLHRPMVTHPGMTVDYVDRFPIEKLKEHYPELAKEIHINPNIIDDAETLSNIKAETYDFVISAHVIEHMKNPILALKNWCRVLEPDGLIYLVVPDHRKIFDKYRHRTSLEHLILDYTWPSDERDKVHYFDYALNVNKSYFGRDIDENEEYKKLIDTNYSIHFHCFIPEDIVNLVNWFSENVRKLEILEGPVASEGSDEFHLLLRV